MSLSVDEALAELGLPPFEDLEPLELQYLRAICRFLQQHPPLPDDDGRFDRDELGIDPEEDYE